MRLGLLLHHEPGAGILRDGSDQPALIGSYDLRRNCTTISRALATLIGARRTVGPAHGAPTRARMRSAGGPVLLCAMVIALAGCAKSSDTASTTSAEEKKPDANPVTVEVAHATVRPMESTISAPGTLTPAQGATARVAAVVAGRLSDVRVREGDHVTRGEILAVVGSGPQAAQARSAAVAVTAAEAQARQADIAANAAAADQANSVRQAELALSGARLDADNAIRQARIGLNSAQTDLAKLRAGARPQEIAQAEQTVNQNLTTRNRAATELKRVQFLFDQGIAAQRQLDDAKTALDVANATLESARQQASLVHAGTRSEDVRAGELRVEQAQEALAQARTTGQGHVAQAQAALRQAQQGVIQVAVHRQEARVARETVAQRRADLAAAQAVAGYAVLRSPLTGTVTHRTLNPGDQADPATPVLEVTDTRTLNLLANLSAEEGRKVRPGMSARLTTADGPGRRITGRVVTVGQVDPQSNLLAVRISVPNPGGRLKVGTFATAEIILHTDPQAIVAPKEAVITREGKSVLFVVGADDVAHQKAVTLGAQQGGWVQILLGIAPGDTVVRLGQYELTDGARVRRATAASGA
jgi:HlyD family secretion protein